MRVVARGRDEAWVGTEPPPTTTKAPLSRGLRNKRLKGLEPSTFCMASRRSSQLSYSRRSVLGEHSEGVSRVTRRRGWRCTRACTRRASAVISTWRSGEGEGRPTEVNRGRRDARTWRTRALLGSVDEQQKLRASARLAMASAQWGQRRGRLCEATPTLQKVGDGVRFVVTPAGKVRILAHQPGIRTRSVKTNWAFCNSIEPRTGLMTLWSFQSFG